MGGNKKGIWEKRGEKREREREGDLWSVVGELAGSRSVTAVLVLHTELNAREMGVMCSPDLNNLFFFFWLFFFFFINFFPFFFLPPNFFLF